MKNNIQLTKSEIREMIFFNSVYGKGPLKDLCMDITRDKEFPWNDNPKRQLMYLRARELANPLLADAVDEFEEVLTFPYDDHEDGDIEISNPPSRVKITIHVERE